MPKFRVWVTQHQEFVVSGSVIIEAADAEEAADLAYGGDFKQYEVQDDTWASPIYYDTLNDWEFEYGDEVEELDED